MSRKVFVLRAIQGLLAVWFASKAAGFLYDGRPEIAVNNIVFALVLLAMIEAVIQLGPRLLAWAEKSRNLYPADTFSEMLAQALSRAQAQVKVFTYPLPAEAVKETLGMVRGVSETEASSSQDFRLAEQEALLLMLKHAHDLGANAVVGVSLTTGTYETNGSQWQVSRPVYTGTAVRI